MQIKKNQNAEFGIRNSEFGIRNSYGNEKMSHLGHRSLPADESNFFLINDSMCGKIHHWNDDVCSYNAVLEKKMCTIKRKCEFQICCYLFKRDN